VRPGLLLHAHRPPRRRPGRAGLAGGSRRRFKDRDPRPPSQRCARSPSPSDVNHHPPAPRGAFPRTTALPSTTPGRPSQLNQTTKARSTRTRPFPAQRRSSTGSSTGPSHAGPPFEYKDETKARGALGRLTLRGTAERGRPGLRTRSRSRSWAAGRVQSLRSCRGGGLGVSTAPPVTDGSRRGRPQSLKALVDQALPGAELGHSAGARGRPPTGRVFGCRGTRDRQTPRPTGLTDAAAIAPGCGVAIGRAARSGQASWPLPWPPGRATFGAQAARGKGGTPVRFRRPTSKGRPRRAAFQLVPTRFGRESFPAAGPLPWPGRRGGLERPAGKHRAQARPRPHKPGRGFSIR